MVDSLSISAEIRARRGLRPAPGTETAFLVLDTESVPDGRLLAKVKYPGEDLAPNRGVLGAVLLGSGCRHHGQDRSCQQEDYSEDQHGCVRSEGGEEEGGRSRSGDGNSAVDDRE